MDNLTELVPPLFLQFHLQQSFQCVMDEPAVDLPENIYGKSIRRLTWSTKRR
jgi:hypothetical protein